MKNIHSYTVMGQRIALDQNPSIMRYQGSDTYEIEVRVAESPQTRVLWSLEVGHQRRGKMMILSCPYMDTGSDYTGVDNMFHCHNSNTGGS